VHPQKVKIRKFLENGCIKKEDDNTYVCLPLLGYNISTYTIKRRPDGRFSCNCQGYNKRGDCSHVQAVYLKMGDDVSLTQGVLF
jgi:hypothetical protein